MSIADFVKGLPCHNSQNFQHFSNDGHVRNSQQKRASVYLPTEEVPSEQIIVLDKRCVLLRYLTSQWDKKSLPRKRDHVGETAGSNGTAGSNSCKKRPRLDPQEIN